VWGAVQVCSAVSGVQEGVRSCARVFSCVWSAGRVWGAVHVCAVVCGVQGGCRKLCMCAAVVCREGVW
jgi:hypothetical protein